MMQFFFVFLHPIIVYSNLEVRYKYHTIRKARVHHINFQNNYTDRHGIHKRRKIRQRHHGADCRPLQGNPQAFGGRPATRRTAQDSGTRRKGIAVPHRRHAAGRFCNPQQRTVQGRIQADGPGQGH